MHNSEETKWIQTKSKLSRELYWKNSKIENIGKKDWIFAHEIKINLILLELNWK